MSDWGVAFDGGEPAQTQLGFGDFANRLLGGTFTETLAEVGEYFEAAIDEQFATQGARGGGWESLSNATIKRKGHGTILFDSGELVNSWESPFTGRDEITIRSRDYPKVLYHTAGDDVRGRFPARPPFVILGDDLEAVDRIFLGKVDEALGASFR